MKKVYSLPKVSIIGIVESSILASSSMSCNRNVNLGTFMPKVDDEYFSLTYRQKLAVLNLMKCFGAGSCPCTAENMKHKSYYDSYI